MLENIKEELLEIWQEVFENLEIKDKSFFELGGNSLMAIKISVRVKEHFGVNIEVKEVFDNVYLDELSELIFQKKGESEIFEI